MPKEIDRWFSWFDGFNFSLSLPANGETYIAKFTGEGAEFELYLELAPLDSGGGNLQYDLTPILRAEYPASAPYGNEASNKKIVSTPCSLIRSLSIVPYSANSEYSPNESEALVLRFLVSMHITEGVYACEIAYK